MVICKIKDVVNGKANPHRFWLEAGDSNRNETLRLTGTSKFSLEVMEVDTSKINERSEYFAQRGRLTSYD